MTHATRLARRLARSNPSTEVDDLVQDGMVAMLEARSRFDPTRGASQTTFFEKRIWGGMIDGLRRQAWPRGIRKERRQLQQAREAHQAIHGHAPTDDELAARLGWSVRQVSHRRSRIDAIERMSGVVHESGPVREQTGDAQLPERLTWLVPEGETPEQAFQRREAEQQFGALIDRLPRRERQVIRWYFYDELTCQEIGKRLGVNESRASQLKTRAQEYLRRMLVRRGDDA